MRPNSASLCALVAALCAIAFTATVQPSSASAAARTSAMAKFPTTGAAMQTALRTAFTFWNRTPCGGAIALRWVPMADDVVAQAEWLAFDPDDASSYLDCSISFNERGDFTARELCAATVHEVGHLNGFDHDDAAEQPVMDAHYAGAPSACVKAMAPFMPAKRKAAQRKRTTTVSLGTARVSITTRR